MRERVRRWRAGWRRWSAWPAAAGQGRADPPAAAARRPTTRSSIWPATTTSAWPATPRWSRPRREALAAYGLGATGSRLVRGSTDAARRPGGGAGRLAGRRAGAGLLLRLPGQPRRGPGAGRPRTPAGLRRAQPRLADRRLPDLRRGDRRRAARRPGRGGGRSLDAPRRPPGGGGHRVGLLGRRRPGAAAPTCTRWPGARRAAAGRRRPRARRARPGAAPAAVAAAGLAGRAGRGRHRDAVQVAGRRRRRGGRPGAADPAPGRHRPHVHLRHRAAAGRGGRRAGGAATGPRRPTTAGAVLAARGRAWRSPAAGGRVRRLRAGGRGGVGDRARPGGGGRLGGGLPRPGRRGRLLPATVHTGRYVAAAADGQRGRARARTSTGRWTWSWSARRDGRLARRRCSVTGTDTGVGKTMVTAAIAAAAQAAGLRVAVVKPGQTGTAAGEPSDVDVVRPAGRPGDGRTLASYPGPAGAAGRRPGGGGWRRWSCTRSSTRSASEAETHDLVLVEGAGGLLVPMGLRPSGEPWTVADLAVSLGAPAVVVARAGLGHAQPHRADAGGAGAARRAGGRGAGRLAGRAGAGALGQPDRPGAATWSARCPTAPARWTRACSGAPRPAG